MASPVASSPLFPQLPRSFPKLSQLRKNGRQAHHFLHLVLPQMAVPIQL
ncbi:unnamed protein product [Ixodes pacificus]